MRVSVQGQWVAFFVYWLVAMVPFGIVHSRWRADQEARGVKPPAPLFQLVFGVVLAPIALLVALACAWEALVFGLHVLAGR
jgi:hypothetical protein